MRMETSQRNGQGRTALLVLDVQKGIVEYGGNPEMLERLATAVEAARGAGVRVIHVKVGFREGYPEICPGTSLANRIARSGGFVEGESSKIHDAVAPAAGDVVVTKRRIGAFAGTDLDLVLRAAGIESLVLAGISTSGAVLSTVRAAADLDYRLTVLADGCAEGGDGEVHRVLMEKVFPRQAAVQSVGEWIATLDG
jgi:nicotinamidase-related amidase